MGDIDVQRLILAARAAGDGALWRDAGRALSRVGRFDEAGEAFFEARRLAVPVDELLDELAPSLDEIAVERTEDDAVWYSRPHWAPDSTRFRALRYARGREKSIVEWRVATRAASALWTGVSHSFSPSRDGSRALVALNEAPAPPWLVRELDLASGRPRDHSTHPSAIEALEWSWDERHVFVGYHDRVVTYAREGGVDPIGHVHGHRASVAPGGGTVVLRGDRRLVRTLSLLDPLSRRPRAVVDVEWLLRREKIAFTTLDGARFAAGALPGGRALLFCGEAKTLLLFSREGALMGRVAMPRVRSDHYPDIASSPSGRLVAAVEGDKNGTEIMVADLFLGRARSVFTEGHGAALAWAPSGRRFAVLLHHGGVVIVELGATARAV